jgi:putative phosphoesterase
MKRIGVISDTHGALSAIDACVKKAGCVDGWFHLGDYAHDAERLRELTDKPVLSVSGNCDGYSCRQLEEIDFGVRSDERVSERLVIVEKARIFLCHGHYYDVDLGIWTLSLRARELGCAAALFGHTHIPEISCYGSAMFLNPGSPARPRAMAPRSFALLTVDGRDVNASIIKLD